MAELGDLLRQTRESLGYTVEQVEEATRIRHVFIQALEDERFGDLPGGVYVKGFLRNYAQFLELDADDVLDQYHKTPGTAPRQMPKVLDEPLLKNTRPSLGSRIFVIVMIALVLAIAGWYGYQRFYLGNAPWSPSGLATLFQRSTPAPTATTAPHLLPTAVVSPTMEPVPTEEPEPTEASVVIEPTIKPTEVVRTSIPSPTPRPRVTRTATPTITPTPDVVEPISGIRVEARIVAPTYVSGSLDGVAIEAVILEAGEEPVWTANESVLLTLGNAGGIELTVNGVNLGRMGDDGEVLDVEYTPETLPQN